MALSKERKRIDCLFNDNRSFLYYLDLFCKSLFVISLRIFVSFENSVSCFWLFGYLFRRSRLSLRLVIFKPPFVTILIYFLQTSVFYYFVDFVFKIINRLSFLCHIKKQSILYRMRTREKSLF